MSKLYYTPPSQECFDELKKEAISIWNTYDDEHGYASSKINKIKDMVNVGDNFMYMVAMFDSPNQHKLAKTLSEQTRKAVRDRMTDGGTPDYLIYF